MRGLANCRAVDPAALPEAVRALHDTGWRLITASCLPRRTGHTVLYHFERSERLQHLRVELPPGGSVPSIGSIYPGAFLVENEMAELQGLAVSGLAIDYGGRLYRDFDGPEGWVHDAEGATSVAETATPIMETAGLTRLDACVSVDGDREVRPTTTRVPVGPGGDGTAGRIGRPGADAERGG